MFDIIAVDTNIATQHKRQTYEKFVFPKKGLISGISKANTSNTGSYVYFCITLTLIEILNRNKFDQIISHFA